MEYVESARCGAAQRRIRHASSETNDATLRLDPVLEAKVISYLRTTGLRLGLVLNFNFRILKKGIKRIVV